MSITAAQLTANISVLGADQAKAQLAGMGDSVNSTGSIMKTVLGGAALAAGAAVVGFGIQSVKAAGDFQSSMTSLVTGAGESKSNLKLVSDGILDMATKTGTSTQQLTSGMYMIESAGFHGAAGLSVLQAAAEGAKVGNADLGTVAGAVTTVMHDYASSNITATQATSALVTTVADGKTHMQDLSSSLAAVLPLASSLHIPFQQVAGAIAMMTNAGVPAQQASQNLAFAIRSMNVESGPGAKSLTAIGLSANQLHDTLMSQGLPAALQLVEDHIGKMWPLSSEQGQQALKNILGGVAGLNVALDIGGSNMKGYESNIAGIGTALSSTSKDVQGWSDVQDTFNFKLAQAQEVIETLKIKIGTALLPLAGDIVGAFSSMALSVSSGIGSAFTYISEILKSVNTSDFQKAWQDVAGEVQQVGQAFSNLASALDPVKTDFDPLADEIANLAKGGLAIVTNLLRDVSSAFVSLSKSAKDGSGPIQQIESAFKALAPPLENIGKLVEGQVSEEFRTFGQIVQQVGSWFVSSVVPALSQAAPGFEKLGMVILTSVIPALIQIRGVLADVAEHGLQVLLPIFEQLVPPVIALAGNIAGGLASALRVVSPIVADVAKAIGVFANFMIDILSPVIHQVVTTVTTQLLPAIEGLMPAFKALEPLLTGIAVVIGGALAIALSLLTGLFIGVVKGATYLLGGIIQAFGGIVQIISGVVQIVSGLIGLLVDIFTGNFAHIQDDLNSFGGGVVMALTGLGNIIIGIFKATFGTVWGLVSGFVQGVVGFFVQLYDDLVGHSIIPDMINSIVNWFEQLPGRVISAISSLTTSIGSFFTHMASQAVTWGSDLVNGIASGIQSATGTVTNAASNIASEISAHLHFTKPEVGPLADADTWMPDFLDLLASGLNSNLDKVRSASVNVAATIAGGQPVASAGVASSSAPMVGGLQGLSILPSSQGSSGYVPSGAQIVPHQQLNAAAQQQSQITVNPPSVYMDGRILMNALMPYMADAIRYSVGTHNI